MGEYLGAPLWNLVVKCMFKFIRNCYLPAIHALHPSQHLILVVLHNFSFSSTCIVVSYCGFICIPLMTNAFDAFIYNLYSFFADISVQIFYPILKFRFFSCCWIVWTLIFWIHGFIRLMSYNHFLWILIFFIFITVFQRVELLILMYYN